MLNEFKLKVRRNRLPTLCSQHHSTSSNKIDTMLKKILKPFVRDFIHYIYDIRLRLLHSFDTNLHRDKKARLFYEVKSGPPLNFSDGKLNDTLRSGLYWPHQMIQ